MARIQKVDIREIGELSLEKLPTNSHPRLLILQEPDKVPLGALPVKAGSWLKLNLIRFVKRR